MYFQNASKKLHSQFDASPPPYRIMQKNSEKPIGEWVPLDPVTVWCTGTVLLQL